MNYDVVIRNGIVVDGSGRPRYRADVAISADRIARIGRIDERGAHEIDADGHVVTPGFIDAHTHMDAQLFWDPLGTSPSWHGITTVVMGNCGFTLAPSNAGAEHLVLANLEEAEDIPAAAMAAGIEWSWTSFPTFLDAVDAAPKAINYAAQIGHSALRTAVMGERAFTDEASADDLADMMRVLEQAMCAGAFGFTTSVSDHHWTSDGRPVASRVGSWDELCSLVSVLGGLGTGIFQLAVDTRLAESDDVECAKEVYSRLSKLAVETRVPTTFGLRSQHIGAQLEAFDATAAAGGRLFGQSPPVDAPRRVYSFKTTLPMREATIWNGLLQLPLPERLVALQDPALRERLVASTEETVSRPVLDALEIPAGAPPWVTLGDTAAERGTGVVQTLIDLAIETNLDLVLVNPRGPVSPDVERAMKHPWTVMTFSDNGAHVTMGCERAIQTMLLAEWVRNRGAFTLEEAIRMITLVPAFAWNIPERGLIREGMIADLNVFDPETVDIAPPTVDLDLPGHLPRVVERATGFLATLVAGQQTFDAGAHTGALPGRLLRSAVAR